MGGGEGVGGCIPSTFYGKCNLVPVLVPFNIPPMLICPLESSYQKCCSAAHDIIPDFKVKRENTFRAAVKMSEAVESRHIWGVKICRKTITTELTHPVYTWIIEIMFRTFKGGNAVM